MYCHLQQLDETNMGLFVFQREKKISTLVLYKLVRCPPVHTFDGSEILHQLRLVVQVHPIIYSFFLLNFPGG